MIDMNICNWRRGFTVMELLVVISIIGVLASVLYAGFGEVRQETRNKAMMAELKETQLAIELYKAQYGRYPEARTSCDSDLGTYYSSQSTICGTNPYITGLTPEFIAELPSHENSALSSCNLIYLVETSGEWYKLMAYRCYEGTEEPSTGIQIGDDLGRCASSCPSTGVCEQTDASTYYYNSLAVYSSGAECI